MSYQKIPGGRRSPDIIHFYRIAYRNTHQVMVRLSRGVMEKAGWHIGDKVDVEYDDRKQRLRLSKRKNAAFTIGSKDRRNGPGPSLGQVRWTLARGRPDIEGTFHTDNWRYRHTDNAIIINTGPQMRKADE